jgi:WD40 repeat protein
MNDLSSGQRSDQTAAKSELSAGLEDRRLALESRKIELDYELRARELQLKERENGWVQKFFSPFTTTVLAGAIALVGSIFATLMQGRQTLELEERKFEFNQQIETKKQQHELILKMVAVDNEKQAKTNIKFLTDVGLITDPGLAQRLAGAPTVAVIPPPNTMPAQQREQPRSSRPEQLYERPVLIIDPGMHVAAIGALDADAAGRFAVTGSADKTVRIWTVADGRLLRTIRIPAGPGNVGKIFAVAISPDGDLVAAGGWTATEMSDQSIYLYEVRSGKMVKRISNLSLFASRLVFSLDGRHLAAGLNGGLVVYERGQQWTEVFRDYGGAIYGAAFASDGRLATASDDGNVRLYDRDFHLVVSKKSTGGNRPHQIAFSPDNKVLAIGFVDSSTVDVLDGYTLASLKGPNTDGLRAALPNVAWSRDGKTLYASGMDVLAWNDAGHGKRRALSSGNDTSTGLVALADNTLLVTTAKPVIERLAGDGSTEWSRRSPIFDPNQGELAVSADGNVVDLGTLRLDLRALKLSKDPPADQLTAPPKQTGLSIEGWKNASPTLNGKPLELDSYETSRSLAIHPDGRRLVLGTDWTLRAFDATSALLWRRDAPASVRAVNVTQDGRLVVAACADGTVHWYRMDDGRELLAFVVLSDRMDWVAWTPEGYYGATPGAFGVLQWQVNHGFDAAADTISIGSAYRLRRPDALALVLQELETARALGIADLQAGRKDVQIAAGSTKAPGARLHVLTVGISDYGDKATGLRLKFADRDARDVASTLLNTQEGGLYAEVRPQFLHDSTADKAGIFDALAAMQSKMAAGLGADLAVVMFSGHGAVIDGQFYLLPYGVDSSTPDHLKATAISATEFQIGISGLAAQGRVLVLLDVCRSAGLMAGPCADILRASLGRNNVTVLTSTVADELSREDDKWQHGAFTKVLLDAFSAGDVDIDHNGVISMVELTDYVAKHLQQLTGGEQQLGLDQRFVGDIFVAGL